MKTYHNEQGFTLVELLVALVVGMFAISATIGLVTIKQRSHFVQEQIIDAQQNARIALDMMARDLRMAGYDPRCPDGRGAGSPLPCNVAAPDPVLYADATRVDLTADFNENGVIPSTPETVDGGNVGEAVRYAVTGAIPSLTLNRISNNETIPVASNLASVSFSYMLSDGTILPAPLSPADRNRIGRITITLVARTAAEDPYFMGGSNVSGSPDDGTARTRTLTTTVAMRNQ
jgi:type IV pilus assembly protein PilW